MDVIARCKGGLFKMRKGNFAKCTARSVMPFFIIMFLHLHLPQPYSQEFMHDCVFLIFSQIPLDCDSCKYTVIHILSIFCCL